MIFSKRISKFIKKITKKGSFASNLFFPWSNLNIEIQSKFKETNENEQNEKFLQFCQKLVSQNLLNCDFETDQRFSSMRVKARTTDKWSQIPIEIIFRASSKKNHKTNEEIIAFFLKNYPISKQIYLILKFILRSASLDNPKNGGLNGFSLFIMIIALFQNDDLKNLSQTMCEANLEVKRKSNSTVKTSEDTKESDNRRILDNLKDPSSTPITAGKFLMNFLYFYGFLFDYKNQCILSKMESNSMESPFQPKESNKVGNFVILNPSNKNLMITKSFRLFKEMTQLFRLQYNRLFQVCQCQVSSVSIMLKTGVDLSSRYCLTVRETMNASKVCQQKDNIKKVNRRKSLSLEISRISGKKINLGDQKKEKSFVQKTETSVLKKKRLSLKSTIYENNNSVLFELKPTVVVNSYLLKTLLLFPPTV